MFDCFVYSFFMFVGILYVWIYRKLAEEPYKDTVQWEKWHVFWVDERVVKRDHADSNYKLALEGLLCKVQFLCFLLIVVFKP